MKLRLKNHSLTLLELIIAICIVGLALVLLASIATYSRFQLTEAERLAKVESDAAFILEHVKKYYSQAIGNEAGVGMFSSVVWDQTILPIRYYGVFIDVDQDGLKDPAFDHWITYRFHTVNKTLDFCPHSGGWIFVCIPPANWESLSKRTTDFRIIRPLTGWPARLAANFINATVQACYDPSKPCATLENPSVRMNTTITMPLVSVR